MKFRCCRGKEDILGDFKTIQDMSRIEGHLTSTHVDLSIQKKRQDGEPKGLQYNPSGT